MKVYKLTDQDMRTYGGFQWELLVPQATDGCGELCGRGWLHWYESAEVAVFMNPAHGNFDPATMRLFEAEAEGEIKRDYCLKGGSTKLTLVREIAVPVITTEQRIEIAIRCGKLVYSTDEKWNKWADNWLSGADRSASSADRAACAAWSAARAAEAAAEAAAWSAACAAWSAARAAEAAAEAAAWAAAWSADRAAESVAKGDKVLDLVSIAKKVMGV